MGIPYCKTNICNNNFLVVLFRYARKSKIIRNFAHRQR